MNRKTCWRRERNPIPPVVLGLVLAACALARALSVSAGDQVPSMWSIVADDFESGSLANWNQFSERDLRLVSGSGHNGSTALSVNVGLHESYLRQTSAALAEEGYLSFWFDPNSVSIPDQGTSWIPGRSTRVASIRGTAQWHTLVALWVRSPNGQGYKAYLEWRADDGAHYDYESGEFDLVDGWQRVTLGYKTDEWVAVWLDGVLVRRITGVNHDEAGGEVIEIGKTNANTSIADASIAYSGALNYDDIAFQVPRIDDLWVDVLNGDDGHNGLTVGTAFRTIQKAAGLAGPGTTVHILPGIYREALRPAMSGSEGQSVRYVAENGPGSAVIRGSEPSSSLTWTQLTVNSIGLPPDVDPARIYYADLSSWGADGPPRFVVELDAAGDISSRLWPAREPDWQVITDWKVHEFWWSAVGGWAVAGCDPTTDADAHCDLQWRSYTQLTDTSNDSSPGGIEPGNLTTLGNLTGATLIAMDAHHSHYVYRGTITAHDVSRGRVTVNEECEDDDRPGLGWGSKYYVENHPVLLDNPGEWWFDASAGRLYLWPPARQNPATLRLEISRLETGFDLGNRSYVSLDGLRIELFNEATYGIRNENPWHKAHGNTLSNVTLRYANRGVLLSQYVSGETSQSYAIDGFTLEGSEVAYMDTVGVEATFWWTDAPAPDRFTHAGVRNTVIRNNELHHLGFNSDHRSPVGVRFFFPDRLRFEGNHVHHVAQNGIHLHLSLIDSENEYGLAPSEILLGGILVKDNLIERACQLASDCGALKLSGSNRPYTHVFRDVLVTGNVFRDTFGWSDVSLKRGRNVLGDGHGLYVDYASGIHVYRNIAYNNTGAGFKLSCLWRDGDIIYYNNIAANNYSAGLAFVGGGSSCDNHSGSVNTQVVNNILVNNDGHGIQIESAYNDNRFGNLMIDHNLYFSNGWNASAEWRPADIQLFQGSRPTQYFHGLAEIRAGTPWEDHGAEGDPAFIGYDLADRSRYDGSWPDLHITAASTSVLDRGTAVLPVSLVRLLTAFGIVDARFGSAFDIGRYEAAGVRATPGMQAIDPGESAQFILSVYPADFPGSFILSVSSVPSDLTLGLSSTVLMPGKAVTLTVTDNHNPGAAIVPGLGYTITVTATRGAATQYTDLQLLVGGAGLYLPLIIKQGPQQ